MGLDETRELEDVRRMMNILKGEVARRKQVYCLIGNEPIQTCYERAQKIIEWGGEPYCQFMLPLNLLDHPSNPYAKVKLRYDWQAYWQGKDFMRYYNKHFWRKFPIWEYEPRRNEPCPFTWLAPKSVVDVNVCRGENIRGENIRGENI